MKHPLPDEIRLNEAKNALKLQYGNAEKTLPAEFLRVYSPSAEVRGHAPGQEVLQPANKTLPSPTSNPPATMR